MQTLTGNLTWTPGLLARLKLDEEKQLIYKCLQCLLCLLVDCLLCMLYEVCLLCMLCEEETLIGSIELD